MFKSAIFGITTVIFMSTASVAGEVSPVVMNDSEMELLVAGAITEDWTVLTSHIVGLSLSNNKSVVDMKGLLSVKMNTNVDGSHW